jgi:hypothetical protein
MTVVNDGLPCSGYNQQLNNAVNNVNSANIPYNPFSTNSNAFVNNALTSSGMTPGAPLVWVPGWGTNLRIDASILGFRMPWRFRIPWLLGCLLLAGCWSAKADPKALEQRLAAAVPLQSTPNQVLAYLNNQKIEHSGYLLDPTQGNSIKAMIRDKARWSLMKTGYNVLFRFDSHDRLVGYEVRPAYTGP